MLTYPLHRITSYNVCYTKLLRERFDSALGSSPKERNGFVHGLAFPLMILLPLFSFFVLLFTMTEKSGVSGERYFAVKLINQSDKIVKVNMSSVRISKAVDDKPAHVLPSDTEADFFGFVRLVIGRITSYNVCYTKLLRTNTRLMTPEEARPANAAPQFRVTIPRTFMQVKDNGRYDNFLVRKIGQEPVVPFLDKGRNNFV